MVTPSYLLLLFAALILVALNQIRIGHEHSSISYPSLSSEKSENQFIAKSVDNFQKKVKLLDATDAENSRKLLSEFPSSRKHDFCRK